MKILIADRSKQIRDRLEKLIFGTLGNVTVFHTDSNMDAIKYIEENYLDVILFDIDLFDGSGFKILSKTRTVPYDPLKIVFTNHIHHNIEEVSYKLGTDYFLNKSHDFIEIKKILSALNRNDNQRIAN